MKFIRLTEWCDGHAVNDLLINFDYVIKVESAAYDLAVKQLMEAASGDSTKWIEACEDSSNFGVSKITLSNGETSVVGHSVNEIKRLLNLDDE